ncbi:CPBP family intramembrane glutamic endopeptidase [Pseudoalteromonas sp. XMcav11-Q]|uniref:CPBP family intramembrane glutamic endopeptidase n=1 Tax=Pseudoalteromonas sp. XMcav11-Q TaxID=3136665 RepID=UPI0032C3D82C
MTQLKLNHRLELFLTYTFLIVDFFGTLYISKNNYSIIYITIVSSSLLTFIFRTKLINISVIILVKYTVVIFFPHLFTWPIHLIFPLLAFVVITYFSEEKEYYLNFTIYKQKKGFFFGGAVLFTSISSLFIWAYNSNSDIELLNKMIPDLPFTQLLITAFLFSIANAFLEEWLFRGVFQETLLKLNFSFNLSTLIQASTFAIAHYKFGFPSGNIGFAMTFIYACTLTLLARKTGSLFIPLLIHIFTDIAVFYLIVNI